MKDIENKTFLILKTEKAPISEIAKQLGDGPGLKLYPWTL